MAEAKVAELERMVSEMNNKMAEMSIFAERQAIELAEAKRKANSKTVYISKDRKLPKFSGKALSSSEPSIE